MTELRCPDCEAIVNELDCTDCLQLQRNMQAQETAQALLERAPIQTRTHCPKGHEMTPDNTRIDVRADAEKQSITRSCRTCHNLRGITRREKKKAAKKATRGTTRPRERAERSIGAGPHQPGGLISQTLPVQETA
jgi:hypothetical protein